MKRSLAPSALKKKLSDSTTTSASADSENINKFNVLYAEASKRKHKFYTNEGTLEMHGKRAKLMSADGSVR